MNLYVIDCKSIKSEADFWNKYLAVLKPEGAEYFGRNIHALWDALSGGGPGSPNDLAECEIRLINTDDIKSLRNGEFYSQLIEISQELKLKYYFRVTVTLE